MKKYRKKPVIIEAVELDFAKIEIPCSSLVDKRNRHLPMEAATWKVGEDEEGFYLLIPTLEGDMKARNNDFIIKGVNGEFYPCKPDIFHKTYEEV